MPTQDHPIRRHDLRGNLRREAIEDPALRTFVTDLTNLFLVDIAEAVAGDGTTPPPNLAHEKPKRDGQAEAHSVGSVVAKHMSNLDRRAKRRLVGQLLAGGGRDGGKPVVEVAGQGPQHLRSLFSPKDRESVLDRAHVVKRAATLLRPSKPLKPKDAKAWSRHWLRIASGLSRTVSKIDLPGSSGSSGTPPPPQHSFLRFRIHEILCDDKTGEWDKRDEISLAGVNLGVDGVTDADPPPPSTRITGIFDEFDAGKFKDGERKTYSPPHRVCSFQLGQYGDYPHYFLVNLVLAEIDNGGLGDFVADLYAAIEANVTLIIAAAGLAIGSAIASGAAAGSFIGIAGGPIGAAIGVLVGMIVAAVIAAVAHVMQDDIFEPYEADCAFTADSPDFDGSTTSPIQTATYVGFNGAYNVRYSWKLE